MALDLGLAMGDAEMAGVVWRTNLFGARVFHTVPHQAFCGHTSTASGRNEHHNGLQTRQSGDISGPKCNVRPEIESMRREWYNVGSVPSPCTAQPVCYTKSIFTNSFSSDQPSSEELLPRGLSIR